MSNDSLFTLGDFTALWDYLATTKPAQEIAHVPVKAIETSTKAARKQRKKKSKKVSPVLEDSVPEELPELVNVSSASDSEGPATSSDEIYVPKVRISKEDQMLSIRRDLTKHVESFGSKISKSPKSRSVPSTQTRLNNTFSKLTAAYPADFSETRQTYIFVDSSNIFLGFQRYLTDSSPRRRVNKPVMDLAVLDAILERNRPNARKVLVGSKPLLQSWDAGKLLGYDISLLERVVINPDAILARPKKVEQGVDELLHMKMLESLLDAEPSVMVLATGDANVAQYSEGFFSIVLRALARDWKVEIVSFSKNLSALWHDAALNREYKGRFKIIKLDNYIDELDSGA